MEELNGYKQKIQNLSTKESGSLQVRDFTDDIYQKKSNKEMFVVNSEMFQDVLVVLNQERPEQFKEEMHEFMTQYYQIMDNAEKKRIKDSVKSRLTELLNGLAQHEAKMAKKAEEEKKEEKKDDKADQVY